MTEVIADELNKEGGPQNAKLVALSGPTHAEEVALDLPTTSVSACPDEAAAEYVQDVFSNTCMRVYTNPDIKGVEPEYVESDWDRLFAGLDAGRYDIVCNGVEVTDERAKTYDFTEPYGYIHTALAVRKDNDCLLYTSKPGDVLCTLSERKRGICHAVNLCAPPLWHQCAGTSAG